MNNPSPPTDRGPLRAKLRSAWAQLRHLPRTARLVWAASGKWTAAWLAMLVVQGLLPVATVLLAREVVDGIVAAIEAQGSKDSLLAVLPAAGAMGGVLLLGELLRGATAWIRAHQSQLIQDHISALIHDQSAAVDLAFYETPDYYDHLHRARNEAWYRPQKLVENTGLLVQSAVTLVAMAGVLLTFSAWVPLILVASTLPALYVVLKHAVRQHNWRLENTEAERRTWYHDWVLTSSEAASEVRLFDLAGHFKARFGRARARLRRERLALIRAQSLSELAAGALALLATAACLGWMGYRTIQGHHTLGELALFFGAFRQGQQMLRSLLANMGDIYRNVLFLGDLYAFLDLEPSIAGPRSPARPPERPASEIAFREVTFRYPGEQRPVLDRFDLTLRAGRVTAIVGPNGSGKSTLFKLVCRLYDPQQGRIELDGTDIRDLGVDELRGLVTMMFQTPVRYSESAARNVAFGEIGREIGAPEIERALGAAGADGMVSRLPDGMETLLGKWFEGGTELSVGEWQRLALARAFVRRAPVILLDEPTSAMDSWAEADWLGRLRELAEGRTAVIITHRFTTAMGADAIVVMDQGRIVESGTHDELLAQGGSYSASWEAQLKAPSKKPMSQKHR